MTPSDVSLTMPPFPPRVWDGFFWKGVDKLPTWAGFQSRRGQYTTRDRRAASRGDAGIEDMVRTIARSGARLVIAMDVARTRKQLAAQGVRGVEVLELRDLAAIVCPQTMP